MVSRVMPFQSQRSSAKTKSLKNSGILCETEADTITNALKQDWGGFSDILRKGFHYEEVSYARKGEEIKIQSRKVSLYAFDFTKIDIPKVHFHVRCSKGTYIRSLAHDFGKALETGAHLSQLRRTAIGAYTVEDSLTPDQISEKLDGI